MLHFGVASAAAATVISQFVSAALCLYRLMYKSPDDYRISFGRLQLNPFMLKQIVKNGLPAGIQNSKPRAPFYAVILTRAKILADKRRHRH